MPRNSLLNGKAAPDTGGLQLDETSYPILMAYLSGLGGDTTLYAGPHPPGRGLPGRQRAVGRRGALGRADRLLAVHHRRRDRRADRRLGDRREPRRHGAGGLYQATADDFQRNIKSWTVTTTGPDGPRYFIRVSKTGDPNAAITYSLGNGGPTAGPARVIDGGFQELVRLGELPVSDPDVQASLAVLDKQIEVSTPSGTGYYRYGNSAASGSADGYGDCYQPSQDLVHDPRGAVAADRHRHRPPVAGAVRRARRVRPRRGRPPAARSLLQAMINFSSGVGLVPEQAWEDPDLAASPYGSDPATASIGFTDGKAAGSASPLTWAQAQELRLIARRWAPAVTWTPRPSPPRVTSPTGRPARCR